MKVFPACLFIFFLHAGYCTAQKIVKKNGYAGVTDSLENNLIDFNYTDIIPFECFSDNSFTTCFYLAVKNGSIDTVFRSSDQVNHSGFLQSGGIKDRPGIWTLDSMLADLYTSEGLLISENLTDIGIRPLNSDFSASEFPLLELYQSDRIWKMSEPVTEQHFLLNFRRNKMMEGNIIWIRTSGEKEFIVFPSGKKSVFDPEQSIQCIGNNICFYVNNSNKSGIIRMKKEEVLPAEYDTFEKISTATGEQFIILWKNNLTGLMDMSGNIRVQPKWQRVLVLSAHSFLVSSGGKWKFITRPMYEYYPYGDEPDQQKDSVLMDETSGIINSDGGWTVPDKYRHIIQAGNFFFAYRNGNENEEVTFFTEDPLMNYYFNESVYGGVCDVYTTEGNKIAASLDSAFIPLWVLEKDSLKGKYFIAVKKNKWGVMNKNGKWIIKPKYTSIEESVVYRDSVPSLHFICRSGNNFELITEEAGVLLSVKSGSISAHHIINDSIRSFSNNQKILHSRYIIAQGGKWETQVLTYDTFDNRPLTDTFENYNGGRYNLYDTEGNKLTRQWFDSIYQLEAGNAFITQYNNKYGLINANGEMIFPNEYEFIHLDYKNNFILVKNGSSQLIGRQNEIILQGYDDYYLTRDKKYRVRSGDTWGLYDSDEKKWVIPLQYTYIGDDYAGFYPVTEGDLYGLYSVEGEKILEAEYEMIEIFPLGFETNVTLVSRNNKFGFFDKNTYDWILKPIITHFEYEEFSDSLYLIGIENQKPGMMQYGLISSSGELVVPVQYSEISVYNPETKTFRVKMKDTYEYLDKNGIRVSGGETAWKNSWLGSYSGKDFSDAYSFQSLDGPEGMDATAFCEDKNGNWWLGTGSGGGIYFSSDKGKTWSAKNNGIGPVHIVFILEHKDTLFIVYSQTSNKEAIYEGGIVQASWFDSSTDHWYAFTYPDEFGNVVLGGVAYIAGLYNEKFVESENEAAQYLPADYFFIPPWEFENLFNAGDLFSAIIINGDTISEGMPRDAYLNSIGNVFPVKDGYVLLHHSGIKMINADEKRIEPLSESGILASDINQVARTKNGNIIIKESDSDLWEFSKGKWNNLFNSYEFWKENKPSGLFTSTQNFITDENGSVFFPAGGMLLKITSGKTEIIFGENVEVFNEQSENIPGSFVIKDFAIDRNGTKWCLGALSEYDMDDFIYYLAVWDEKNNKLLGSDTSYLVTEGSVPFLFQNHEEAFLVNGQTILNLNSGKLVLDNELFFYNDIKASDFSGSKNGELAWISSGNQVSVLTPDSDEALLLPFDGMSLQAITFDTNGRLYVSAGFSYNYFCEEQPELNPNAGLYRLEMPEGKISWRKIDNPVNPKIISLAPLENNNLLIGTSGSGLLQLTIDK